MYTENPIRELKLTKQKTNVLFTQKYKTINNNINNNHENIITTTSLILKVH